MADAADMGSMLSGLTGGLGALDFGSIMRGAGNGVSIGADALQQLTGQGSGPTNPDPLKNIMGTLMGDQDRPGVLGPLLRSGLQALMGGATGFVQNGGVQAIAAGAAGAAAGGGTPASAATGLTAFMGAGGGQALMAGFSQGYSGFQSSGGMNAIATLTHEITGSIGAMFNHGLGGGKAVASGHARSATAFDGGGSTRDADADKRPAKHAATDEDADADGDVSAKQQQLRTLIAQLAAARSAANRDSGGEALGALGSPSGAAQQATAITPAMMASIARSA